MYRGKGFHRPASKDSGVEPFKRVHHEIQRSQKASTSSSTSQSESPPLGALIKIITRDYLISHESRLDPKAAKIDDAEYAASYSWTNRASPTIFVPGKPPLWTPLKQKRRLNPDSGEYFRDPNAARYPAYPTEPAVRALLRGHPQFSPMGLDFFACGSTMGNLLRFTRMADRSFRFNVDVVGNTVFFVRKENSPTELIPNVRGYGHSFPEAYTSWERDVLGSATHQRLVRYNFAGSNCMIRFEVDGYRKDLQASEASSFLPDDSYASKGTSVSDKVLTPPSNLDGMDVTNGKKSNSRDTSDLGIGIEAKGIPISQGAIFDLKTKHAKYPIDMAEIYPRLWVTRVPNLVIAYHNNGCFEDIRWLDVRKEIEVWEEANAEALAILSILIKEISACIKAHPDKKLEIVRAKVDELEIREQAGEGSRALPPDLIRAWEDRALEMLSDRDYGSDDNRDDDCSFLSDDGSDFTPDYTACTLDDCAYCGRCTY